jgi:hypothetical protein
MAGKGAQNETQPRIRRHVAHNRDVGMGPGHFTVKANGTGEFQLGAVEADIDCRGARVGGTERLEFAFAGFSEGGEVSGRGRFMVDGNQTSDWFCFHLGDESTFKAQRKTRERG